MRVLRALAAALTTIFLLALPVMAQEQEPAPAPAPEEPVPVPECPFAGEEVDPFGTDATGQGANSIQRGSGECAPEQRLQEVPGLLDSVTGVAEALGKQAAS